MLRQAPFPQRLATQLTFALAGLLALAGCAAESLPPESSPPPVAEDTDCGAGMLGAYVGHKATDEVMAAIRQWRGDNPVRMLRHGSAMTMDYRPGRLNVFLDNQDRIEKFGCN